MHGLIVAAPHDLLHSPRSIQSAEKRTALCVARLRRQELRVYDGSSATAALKSKVNLGVGVHAVVRDEMGIILSESCSCYAGVARFRFMSDAPAIRVTGLTIEFIMTAVTAFRNAHMPIKVTCDNDYVLTVLRCFLDKQVLNLILSSIAKASLWNNSEEKEVSSLLEGDSDLHQCVVKAFDV
ncbi:unnamed protein product [Heligmosomoides polygyrus]|uniref:RNase H domain-containing protein n=1 Tax=Heligmosomoides polygyrus TaxID=6339 RepID=A0A183FIQ5_HELPZ|nr:unnamed protein product [Heligmosomoides polygyrus]